MNKEEMIKELKNKLPYLEKSSMPDYSLICAIETSIDLIDKQEKIIDSLAQWVSNLSPLVDKQTVKDIVYKEIESE